MSAQRVAQNMRSNKGKAGTVSPYMKEGLHSPQ